MIALVPGVLTADLALMFGRGTGSAGMVGYVP